MAGKDTDDREPVFRDASVRFTSGIPRITARGQVVNFAERVRIHQKMIVSGWETLSKRGYTDGREPPDSETLIKDLDEGADVVAVMDRHLEEHKSWWENTEEKQGVDPEFKPKDPPMVGILMQWLTRPVEATPFHPNPRASVPSLHRTSDHEVNTLPRFTDANVPQQPEQIPLPGFEPVVTACPSWILWLYDQASGGKMRAGRGVPWDLHLFVGAFLHLAIKDRTGHWKAMRFPHLIEHEADWPIPGTPSIERWLFPDGWDRSNKRRYWERLPQALQRMSRDLSYVPVNELGSVAMVFPSVIPKRPDQPLVEFTIRVPQSAAKGARIDWGLLRKYRKESSAQYRAYLSASAFIDRSAHQGHGITAEIAAPLLKADGTPQRRKGGTLIRGNSLIPNPQSRYVKSLDSKDLTRMIGFDPEDSRYRDKAIKAFEKLHEDGVINLQKDAYGWKIFITRQEKAVAR